MADFPYVPNPARLRTFLPKIQEVGVPPKATTLWLPSIGFKSKNDRGLLRVLKALDFLSADGKPTELWRSYRSKSGAAAVLANAIRSAYGTLFATYPDAERKDDEALRDFFKSHTSLSDAAVTYVLRTFKTLCEMADFQAPALRRPAPTPQAPPGATGPRPALVTVPGKGVTINLRIELALPPSEDGAIYEKFFEAMKKHLLS